MSDKRHNSVKHYEVVIFKVFIGVALLLVKVIKSILTAKVQQNHHICNKIHKNRATYNRHTGKPKHYIHVYDCSYRSKDKHIYDANTWSNSPPYRALAYQALKTAQQQLKALKPLKIQET